MRSGGCRARVVSRARRRRARGALCVARGEKEGARTRTRVLPFSFPSAMSFSLSMGRHTPTATGNEPEVSEFPDSRSTSAFMGTDIVPDPEVGDPPDGGIKRVPHLATGKKVGLGVGEPPGYGGGCTPTAFGLKADLEEGEPPKVIKNSPLLATDKELSHGVGEPPGNSNESTSTVTGFVDVPSVAIKCRSNGALRPTATGSLSRDDSPPSQAAEADKSENYSSTYEKNLYAFFSFASATFFASFSLFFSATAALSPLTASRHRETQSWRPALSRRHLARLPGVWQCANCDRT